MYPFPSEIKANWSRKPHGALLWTLKLTGVMLATAASSVALANVQVFLYATDPAAIPATTSLTASGDISASQNILNGGSSAFATGSLSTGVLRSASRSALPTSQLTDTRAFANVYLSDTIFFNAGATGTAYLDWGFDGHLFTNPQKYGVNAFSGGTLDIQIFPTTGGIQTTVKAQLTNDATCQSDVDHCTHDPSVALRGTLEIPIISQSGYRIDVNLSAASLWGDEADFGNTSYLFLRLPDGVKINSASGEFLADATPVPAVHEPASVYLLLAGAALLLGRTREKWQLSQHVRNGLEPDASTGTASRYVGCINSRLN